MIDKCQECQNKPAANIVLIAEWKKLGARAMCKDCTDYLKPWGVVQDRRTVTTVALPIPKELLDRVKSDPSNANYPSVGATDKDHE